MLSIHKAVAENSIQRVQKLIDEGANVNASGFEIRHNGKCTPLQVAAYKGYEDITELLILNGAMLEAKNQRGETAIHMAIEAKNSKIVYLLLKKGANIEARNDMNQTPLHLATQLGNCEIIQLLLDFKADINAIQTWKTTKTPLQIAIIKDDVKATRILLKNGANPNLAPTNQLGFGLIPIHIGITLKVFDIVELLIAYNADLNLKDHRGYTPMHWAIHRRNMKTMKVLLMHGASVDIQDMNGNNVFEKALNMDLDHVAKMIWFDQL